jgi:predicted component of type VI protein secretion system
MAIPQTLQNLAILEPDARETSAFVDVKVRGYYAFTVDIAGGALPDTPGGFELLNRNLSAGLNQDPLPLPPSVTLISRQSAQGPASAYAVSESPLSTTQALAAITEQLDHVPPSAIENVTLNKFNNHIFQPHFPTEALARSPSPYTIINGIQVRDCTLGWVGTPE